MLEQVAQYRSPPASSDVWEVVREWLVRHGVKAPNEPLK